MRCGKRKMKKIRCKCLSILLILVIIFPGTVCYGAELSSPGNSGNEAGVSDDGLFPEGCELSGPFKLLAAAGVVTGSIFTCNVSTSADNVNKVFTFTLTATSSAKQTGAPRWYILFDDYSLKNANVTSPVGKFYTQSIVKNNTTAKTVANPTANYDGTGQKKFADSITYLCTYADYSASMTITLTNPISAITGIGLVSQAGNWRFESPKTGFDVSKAIEETLTDPIRNYNLTVNARVPVGQIMNEYGSAVFRYRIVNNSTGKTSWMVVSLNSSSAQSGGYYVGSGTYSLVQGNYTVTPMTMSRYRANIADAAVNLTSNAQVTVTHSISGYRKFSHAAVLAGL